MSSILILIIKLYQLTLSPLLGGSCRFEPSCSKYAIDAIKTHGSFTGTFLAVKRILKCNPFFRGGYDPVPGKNCSHNLNKI